MPEELTIPLFTIAERFTSIYLVALRNKTFPWATIDRHNAASTSIGYTMDCIRNGWRIDHMSIRSLLRLDSKLQTPYDWAEHAMVNAIVAAVGPDECCYPPDALSHLREASGMIVRPTMAWCKAAELAMAAEHSIHVIYLAQVKAFLDKHPIPPYRVGTQGFDDWHRKFPKPDGLD